MMLSVPITSRKYTTKHTYAFDNILFVKHVLVQHILVSIIQVAFARAGIAFSTC